MNDILTIAQSTFSRMAKTKSTYFILLICIGDVWAMARYKEISLGMEQELMIDCAMAIGLIVGLITAMAAAFEVPRELREKTAQFILSKPGGRGAFVWGKFLGVAALCVWNIAIITAGSLLVYRAEFGTAAWDALPAFVLVGSEALVLTAVGLLLGTITTDTMAAIGTFVIFFLGHSLYMLPRGSNNALFNLVSTVLPNFGILDVKTAISHGMTIPSAYVGMGVAYGVAYALALVSLTTIIFSRKDLS